MSDRFYREAVKTSFFKELLLKGVWDIFSWQAAHPVESSGVALLAGLRQVEIVFIVFIVFWDRGCVFLFICHDFLYLSFVLYYGTGWDCFCQLGVGFVIAIVFSDRRRVFLFICHDFFVFVIFIVFWDRLRLFLSLWCWICHFKCILRQAESVFVCLSWFLYLSFVLYFETGGDYFCHFGFGFFIFVAILLAVSGFKSPIKVQIEARML